MNPWAYSTGNCWILWTVTFSKLQSCALSFHGVGRRQNSKLNADKFYCGRHDLRYGLVSLWSALKLSYSVVKKNCIYLDRKCEQVVKWGVRAILGMGIQLNWIGTQLKSMHLFKAVSLLSHGKIRHDHMGQISRVRSEAQETLTWKQIREASYRKHWAPCMTTLPLNWNQFECSFP